MYLTSKKGSDNLRTLLALIAGNMLLKPLVFINSESERTHLSILRSNFFMQVNPGVFLQSNPTLKMPYFYPSAQTKKILPPISLDTLESVTIK